MIAHIMSFSNVAFFGLAGASLKLVGGAILAAAPAACCGVLCYSAAAGRAQAVQLVVVLPVCDAVCADEAHNTRVVAGPTCRVQHGCNVTVMCTM